MGTAPCKRSRALDPARSRGGVERRHGAFAPARASGIAVRQAEKDPNLVEETLIHVKNCEHFAIYAADAPAALKRFYEEAFGMRTVVSSGGDPPGFFLVDERGFAIEIIGRPRPDRPGRTSLLGLATWRSGSTISPRPAKAIKEPRDRLRARHLRRQRDDPDRLLQRPGREPAARSSGGSTLARGDSTRDDHADMRSDGTWPRHSMEYRFLAAGNRGFPPSTAAPRCARTSR